MENNPYTNKKEEMKETVEKVVKPVETVKLEDTPDTPVEPEVVKPNYDVAENNIEPLFEEVTKEIKLRKDDRDFAINTVRGTHKTMEDVVSNLDISKIPQEKHKEAQEWIESLLRASDQTMMGNDLLDEVSTRQGSHWSNGINYGTDEQPKWAMPVNDVRGRVPGTKPDSASKALNLMTSILNLGSPVYICLYHTGIWLRLRTPTAAAFTELDERIVSDRVEYGEITRGQIFSNDSVVLRKHVADFILKHVEWSTAPGDDDPEYLKSIIKVTDLDEMMRGIMQSRYPDGYDYTSVCTADYTKCTHRVEGKIDLRTLNWVDTTKLTNVQKAIIASPRVKISEDQLQQYQDEFGVDGSHYMVFGTDEKPDLETGAVTQGIVLTIEAPTLEQDEEFGLQWINEVKEAGEEAFREKNDTKEREARIEAVVRFNLFKTYLQWIKYITVYKDGVSQSKIENDGGENIAQFIEYLSSERDFTIILEKRIKAWFKNNLVQMVGIVNYECPNCGAKLETAEGSHYMILPIDMLNTFFTLVQSSLKRSILPSNM